MNLRKVLKKSNICVNLSGKDKPAVLGELLDVIMAGGAVKDRDAAYRALIEREEKMSTGMELGIAIPHARTDAVSDLQVAIGVHPTGIDFNSLDGAPCRIFIMTLAPTGRAGPHIQFIAAMSGIFSDPQKRESILNAKSAGEALSVLL
ncbi:PTS sugar transporter subunit IIA [Myxococcota bacterium]|nr:PTS sugar transporter subunit IIA [Myxococcota bacterium]MBU1535055.1 PTS sugar transporter subunit IIA [Myxococcota bacterium]